MHAAGIPIAVSNRSHGDSRGPLGAPDSVVADRFARGDIAHRDHPGRERHGGEQAQIGRAAFGKGRSAIEHEAGPHPFAVGFRPRDDAGGVGDAAFQAQRFAQSAQAIELQSGLQTVRVLRTRQMRQQTHRADRRARLQSSMCRGDLFRPEAEPIHTRIDFQPDCEAVRAGVLLQHRDLLERVNHELQIVGGC
jgi:hypothetical protein